jgi:putative ABC transport system permease protein
MFETLLQDIRFSARMLRKRPGFTAAILIVLALGIGGVTAIFSIVNTVLLRPLPYKDSERLVMLWENNPKLQMGFDQIPVSPANLQDWRDQSQVFESVGAFWVSPYAITGGDNPLRVEGARMTASVFPMLGVAPLMGRTFLPEEEQVGNDQVVVLSYGLWQRRFGSDNAILGKTVMLNGQTHTVIGVMPADFQFPRRSEMPAAFKFFPPQSELWTPMSSTPAQAANRSARSLAAIARLKPTASIEQAQTEMRTIAQRLEQEYPKTNAGFGVSVISAHEQAVGEVRSAFLILLGVVAFVLLIACANVANLLLARAASRGKEIAIRTALGASRSRLIRQLLTESVMLGVIGGALGLLVAIIGLKLLLAFSPANIPRAQEIGIDGVVLGFTFLISVVTGLVFGLVPALRASKLGLHDTLKEGGRSSASGGRRTRNVLVVSEIALALILLIGAGLLVKSFLRLQQINPGFNLNNILTMEIDRRSLKEATPQQSAAFYQQVIERTKGLPGVTSVAVSTNIPLGGATAGSGFLIENRPPPPAGQEPLADLTTISPDFFQTMGIKLIDGHFFTEHDGAEAPKVAIISKIMADRFWPNESPIGKHIHLGAETGVSREIVGVVANVGHSSLTGKPRPEIYLPYLQGSASFMYLVAHTTPEPTSLVASVRSQVWAVDKDQPVSNIKTMEQIFSESVAQPSLYALLLSLFAGVALILAGVGIYGVMAYSVTQRTNEIGIRLALGARPGNILKLIIGQGMFVAVIGLVIGLVVAFIVTRLMTSLLYGVSASDPLTFGIVTLILASVAFLACYIPARRAAGVDPMVALRQE